MFLGNIKNLGLNEGDNNNIDNNNNTDAINSPKYCNVLPPGVSITTASNNNDNNNNNIPKINMKKPFQFSKKLQDLYERYVLNAKDDSDHEMEQPVARTTDKLIQQGVTTIRVRSRSAQANVSIGNTGRSKSYHNIHTASATLSEKPTSFGSQNGGTYCGSFVSDPLDNCGYVIRSTKLHIKPQFIVTGCSKIFFLYSGISSVSILLPLMMESIMFVCSSRMCNASHNALCSELFPTQKIRFLCFLYCFFFLFCLDTKS